MKAFLKDSTKSLLSLTMILSFILAPLPDMNLVYAQDAETQEDCVSAEDAESQADSGKVGRS